MRESGASSSGRATGLGQGRVQPMDTDTSVSSKQTIPFYATRRFLEFLFNPFPASVCFTEYRIGTRFSAEQRWIVPLGGSLMHGVSITASFESGPLNRAGAFGLLGPSILRFQRFHLGRLSGMHRCLREGRESRS